MSAKSNVDEECIQNKCLPKTNSICSIMENLGEVNNISYRLHTSHNSTTSNESEVSLLSLSLDKELESNVNTVDIDELPAFEIRLISPLGRSPSPIDSEDAATPTRPLPLTQEFVTLSQCRNNPDYVALHEINAQISPPSDHGEDESSLSRTSSLETIFEGVFLSTPPRKQINFQNRHNRSRINKLEKAALNRLNSDKENQFPLLKCETNPPKTSIDIKSIQNSCTNNSNFFSL